MHSILDEYTTYHPDPKISKVQKAYEMAEIAYNGEKRLNGESWLSYVKRIAFIVTENKLDTDTLCAAFLLDAYKFGYTKDEIAHEVGGDVANILDGIDSLRSLSSKYNVKNLDVNYASYLRQVILLTGQDMRVVALRIMQKLVGLQGMEPFSEARKRDQVTKVMEIYAPLATLIGLNRVERKLRQEAFKVGFPEDWQFCENVLMESREIAGNRMLKFVSELETLLMANGVPFEEIKGREKEHYSLFKKMNYYAQKYNTSPEKTVDRIKDKWAFRIISPSIADCYNALSLLHSEYEFLPDQLDDYIAQPKNNGYRSLQTILAVNDVVHCEVQIRTPEMHEYNEFGLASHFYYKLYGEDSTVESNKLGMLKDMLLWKEEIFSKKQNPDLSDFEEELVTFTPKGDVIVLPGGSTPIDFAYAIHTDLGNKATMAKVNGKQASLTHILKSGDVVEITISNSRARPNPDWLNVVKSQKARISLKKALAKN